MTDVFLFDEPDGGNIEIREGRVTLSDTLETAVYLALFGGNEQDGGGDDDLPREWWGNKIETVPARKYRSEFQRLLVTVAVTPSTLSRFRDAAERDLEFLVSEGLATAVVVSARITAPKRIVTRVLLEANGEVVGDFTFDRTGTVA